MSLPNASTPGLLMVLFLLAIPSALDSILQIGEQAADDGDKPQYCEQSQCDVIWAWTHSILLWSRNAGKWDANTLDQDNDSIVAAPTLTRSKSRCAVASSASALFSASYAAN